MAYGLIINGSDGTEWFNSDTNSFGFVEIAEIAYSGSSVATQNFVVDEDYSAVYAIYVPAEINGHTVSSASFGSDNNKRPTITTSLSAPSGGTRTLSVTVDVFGGGGEVQEDGRVLVFAH